MPSVERQLASSPLSSPIASRSGDDAVQISIAPLDLSVLPLFFVLPTHLSVEELDSFEERILDHGGKLTYDMKEAKIVLGKVASRKRVELELRSRGLWTTSITAPSSQAEASGARVSLEPPRKRARLSSTANRSPEKSSGTFADISGSTTEDEGFDPSNTRKDLLKDANPANDHAKKSEPITLHESSTESEPETKALEVMDVHSEPRTASPDTDSATDLSLEQDSRRDEVFRVVKLQWLEDCIAMKAILPFDGYMIYEGLPVPRPSTESAPQLVHKPMEIPRKPEINLPARTIHSQSILERAKADISSENAQHGPSGFLPAPHGERRFRDQGRQRKDYSTEPRSRTDRQLLAQTTSEFEGTDSDIPPAPDWVKKGLKYACQRIAIAHPPNESFTDELEKIRLARILVEDEVGVRAYSTSIAALRSYPYKIISPREILRLPGCDVKIANLWIEWKNTGHIKAADDAEKDETLTILRDFYNIWGVGAHTAREFYYDRGWKDRDDIVEYGWSTLTRVQQIGVKYYEEFQQGIPRAEVEFIARKVKEHAVRVRDEGIELMVVGGYRRGKEFSGDVDMIVSHRRLAATANLVTDIVASLESEDWITHTLLLALTSTERKQATLPFKATGVASHGAGFDTLDKALVVWQDPSWPTREQDLARDRAAKNPAPHRRVDIIISPWRTVGCAVYGWSGGTTFQRDTRRYAKNVKGWKFDSSGIRSRGTGEVVRLEGENGVDGSMLDAEKAVFAGLALPFREAWERCTG